MDFTAFLDALNAVLWHDSVLYILLGVGVLFTVWSGFSQYRAMTHGVRVIRGDYDNRDDPGALNHFQALSAALSGTIGLGNIGGVALAVALGGPGAVFWMWVVGFFGMALKLTEVTQAMLFRNTDNPDNPHGGPMWVASKGLASINPKLAGAGKFLGGLYCVAMLVSCMLDGNLFQAWNVANVTESYFGMPALASGVILAVLVGLVIIGGIKRIGSVTGSLVPAMCAIYLLAALYVLITNITALPGLLQLIVVSAFNPQEAAGAFLGGTVGFALLAGMRRAFYSNEAGRGSAAMAHSAAKTDEPVREGVVAGLAPFIDTLVICTLTALVILVSGVWNRDAEANYGVAPEVVQVSDTTWTVETLPVPAAGEDWPVGEDVFMIMDAGENRQTGNTLHRLDGVVQVQDGEKVITWEVMRSAGEPAVHDTGVYVSYPGAALTAKAFDASQPGLGKWMVTLAVWLFAISTIITWSYYGEQAIVYLVGEKAVLPYKLVYCAIVVIATMGFITTPEELATYSVVGVGLMLWVNVPIMLIMGHHAMRAYHEYIGRLKDGRMPANAVRTSWWAVLRGKNVE
ncbi:MAG TPA: amino acid carrier protein [Gammaproteobacteria bacterium]